MYMFEAILCYFDNLTATHLCLGSQMHNILS